AQGAKAALLPGRPGKGPQPLVWSALLSRLRRPLPRRLRRLHCFHRLPGRSPQVEARQTAVGSPLLADGVDLLRRRQVVKSVEPLNRGPDAEVADWQDVGPLEVDQQKHVGAPSPEPAARRDLGANLVVGK